jgi:hypothetical protein
LFIHTHIHAGLVNGDVSWIWNFEDSLTANDAIDGNEGMYIYIDVCERGWECIFLYFSRTYMHVCCSEGEKQQE